MWLMEKKFYFKKNSLFLLSSIRNKMVDSKLDAATKKCIPGFLSSGFLEKSDREAKRIEATFDLFKR